MTRQKKLLFAGGGYADIPMIQAAKALGFYVITSGNRAEDLGHQFSDETCLEDFSNPQAMLHLAKHLEIDAICACCNDFSALSAAYVAEKMGLPGHDSFETAQTIHHKDRYRAFATHHGIPSPRAEGFSSVAQAIQTLDQFRFPIIVKPVDLTGGKGISVVADIDQAKQALELAFSRSRAKRIVVEEFIAGTRHGLSAFIREGKVVFHFNDNEHYYLNPYLVSAASTPGNIPPEAIAKLCMIAEKVSMLLHLETGIFHIQFILCHDEPIIIEICRRPPGDLYTRFVQIATGVKYPEFIVRGATGLDCSSMTHQATKGYFTRHCVMASRNGKVINVHFDPSVRKNIVDQMLWWKPSDRIEDYLTQKLGILFLQFETKLEMLEKTQSMQELIRPEIA